MIGGVVSYAFMLNLVNFIHFTIKFHNIEPALITLGKMAKFRPQKEINNINYLLQKYEETDDSFLWE
ncbi:hypothetical protein XBKB1_870011 [Xenorhabdus bovienii str. kraussei Becker Underwood]|uniref:Uncharacterized protein n=1 Tax=Xenorhabdus bovienii str. kraussei Becker Underwood TaxID=1398204 RepID=A0A077PQX3_XENBV|nr:hypothetical protein XBKB1_870011 [Xenorhabdus bovienii str. kraussei Becker Underwood]